MAIAPGPSDSVPTPTLPPALAATKMLSQATSGGLPKIQPGTFGRLDTSKLPVENGEQIAARVNGEAITMTQLRDEIKRAAGAQQSLKPENEKDIEAALAVPLLDRLIQHTLVAQYAKKHNLVPSDTEVSATIAKGNSARPDGMKLEDEAARLGLGPASVQAAVRMQLTIEKAGKYVGDLATSGTFRQEDVDRFISDSKAPTTNTATLRASHIVWRATSDMKPAAIADAEAKAIEVKKRIADGMDFGAAARAYSQDRFTAYRAGDLGYFSRGTMAREFEDAAFTLEPGKVSGIIRTPVGFYLIKVTEKHPDNKRIIYSEMLRDGAIADWAQSLHKSAKIEKYL